MGTYSHGEFLDTFGGPPERGETYPDDPDALRDQIAEDIDVLSRVALTPMPEPEE